MSLEKLNLKIPYFVPKTNEEQEANLRAIDRWAVDLIDALLTKIRPAGLVIPWAGDSSPDATLFVFPYGQTLTNGKTTYPRLWANISTVFRSDPNIILPDLRGRGAQFLDNMGGTDAGRLSLANTIGTAGGTETVSHSHPLSAAGHAQIFLSDANNRIRSKQSSVTGYTAERSADITTTAIAVAENTGTDLGGDTDASAPSVLQPLILLNCLITV